MVPGTVEQRTARAALESEEILQARAKADACIEIRNRQLAGIRSRGFTRNYFDPFVNVRLTTIPVATGGIVTAPNGAEFLQSQKAAQLQFGGMYSRNFASPILGSKFHWGVGPVVRLGFQSVTDSERAARVWNLDDDLFHSVTGGVRVTLYHNDVDDSTARSNWSPAAYLDMSWGRFQNFQTATGNTDEAKACLKNVVTCRKGPVIPERDFDRHNQNNRLYVEARLALQYVYLGFDLNNGEGRDDLRFITGLTVGLDRFIRRQE